MVSIGKRDLIAGGSNESITQPEWSPSGVLHFVSDRTGWWNIYRTGDDGIEALTEMEAEFGKPHWVFGNSTYAFAAKNRIICSYALNGKWHLSELDTQNKKITLIDNPYSDISFLKANTNYAVFIGGSAHEHTSVVFLDLDSKKTRVLKKSNDMPIEESCTSIPEFLDFPTSNGLKAHAFYYPPKNGDYSPPPNEKPLLIVISHGGPTSAATTSFNPASNTGPAEG